MRRELGGGTAGTQGQAWLESGGGTKVPIAVRDRKSGAALEELWLRAVMPIAIAGYHTRQKTVYTRQQDVISLSMSTSALYGQHFAVEQPTWFLSGCRRPEGLKTLDHVGSQCLDEPTLRVAFAVLAVPPQLTSTCADVGTTIDTITIT